MGYKREGTVYRLSFTQPDMAGLEVDARSLSTGAMIEVVELAGGIDEKDAAAVRKLLSAFSEALVKWNLEDEHDRPVPATLAGVYAQDFDFTLVIILAWIEAIAGVSAPLGSGSDGGKPSLVASIPMESLSPSRAS